MSADKSAVEHSSPASGEKVKTSAIVSGAVGNILEWYDFITYAFLAAVLGRLFFPADEPGISLLNSLAVFGVGFLIRPVGGIVFGHYGDKVGRRQALSLSIVLMGISTLVMGVLPTYEQIGIAAPLLLVLARLLQGFSAGGELIGSSIFLVEHAPANRRGLVGSYQQVTLGLGFLLGSVVATTVSLSLPEAAFESWGWRVPFLIGSVIALIGIYMRLRVTETPEFESVRAQDEVQKRPIRTAWREHRREMLIVVGFTAGPSVDYYVYLTYLSNFAESTIGLAQSEALVANSLGLIAFVLSVPAFGALSDRIGRRPVLLGHAIATTLGSYPLFLWMDSSRTFGAVAMAAVIGGVFMGSFGGPAIAAYTELFPARVRFSGLSIPYNITLAVCGGFAPFIAEVLSQTITVPLGATIELIVLSIVAVAVYLRMRETHRDALR